MIKALSTAQKIPSIPSSKRHDGEVSFALGGLAKPVHSFQGTAKGLERLRKDRRVASSQGTDICMQGGMRNTRVLSQWLESGGSQRVADLMTAAVDKRVAEEVAGEENLERGNGPVTRYGIVPFLVALRHAVYTRDCGRHIGSSTNTDILKWIWIRFRSEDKELRVFRKFVVLHSQYLFPREAHCPAPDTVSAYREFSKHIRNWNVLNARHGVLSSGTLEMRTESKELRYSDRRLNRSNRVTFDLRRKRRERTTVIHFLYRWDEIVVSSVQTVITWQQINSDFNDFMPVALNVNRTREAWAIAIKEINSLWPVSFFRQL